MPNAAPLLVTGADGTPRCWWCAGDAQYETYHDTEWAQPVAEDTRLFEKICLEGFQAGLSWLTILRKRDNFRNAFAHFDMHRVARFNQSDIRRLLADQGIVRHRGKIEAAINNAQRAIDIANRHGSLAAFLWSYAPADRDSPRWRTRRDIPATTPESHALSNALRHAGFRFVGPTTVYAMMQSVGMVNDHVPDCAARTAAAHARTTFSPPKPRSTHRSSSAADTEVSKQR